MSGIGIQHIADSHYKLCRFHTKLQRDNWLLGNDKRVAAGMSELHTHLRVKMVKLMAPGDTG